MRDTTQKIKILMRLKDNESMAARGVIKYFDCLRLTSCICGQKKHQVIRVQAMLITGGKL
jgi:hypothetical protein